MPQDIYNYAEQEYGQEIDRGFGSSNDVAPISENDLMVVHQLEGMNRPREQWGSSRRTLGLLGMNNNQPMSMVMGNGNSAMGAMTSSERRPRRNRGRNGLVGRVLGRRGNGESGWDVYRICSLGVSFSQRHLRC